MQSTRRWLAGLTALAALALVTGCPSKDKDKGKGTGTATGKTGTGKTEKKEKEEEPEFGPHNGPLVEWGNEELHAEFNIDPEKKEVKVYVYGPDHKNLKETPIATDKVTLIVTRPESFTVTLKPENAKDGKASIFSGKDEKLGIKGPIEGRLTAEVGEKKYNGPFKKK